MAAGLPGLPPWAAYLGCRLSGDESRNPWRVSPFTWFQRSPCGGRELPLLFQVCICPWNNPYGQGLVLLRWAKPASCPLPYSKDRDQFQIHLLERVPHKGLCYWKKLGARKSGRIKTIITTAIPATFQNEVGNSLRYPNHGLSLLQATHSCLSKVAKRVLLFGI